MPNTMMICKGAASPFNTIRGRGVEIPDAGDIIPGSLTRARQGKRPPKPQKGRPVCHFCSKWIDGPHWKSLSVCNVKQHYHERCARIMQARNPLLQFHEESEK